MRANICCRTHLRTHPRTLSEVTHTQFSCADLHIYKYTWSQDTHYHLNNFVYIHAVSANEFFVSNTWMSVRTCVHTHTHNLKIWCIMTGNTRVNTSYWYVSFYLYRSLLTYLLWFKIWSIFWRIKSAPSIRTSFFIYISLYTPFVQPIAFAVSFNLNMSKETYINEKRPI